MSHMALDRTSQPRRLAARPAYAGGVAMRDGTPANASTASDAELIAQSREGDTAAIALLVARHADTVYRIAYRLVGQKAQAEDIAQDVLMRMLSYKEGWLSKTSFQVWLRRAVYNRTVDIYRKHRPWQHSGLDAVAERSDGAPAQDAVLAARETETRVTAAVLALPMRQRMAVTLCFYEQMSLAEAGAVLEVSVGAVESLLHRAKATLKQALAPIVNTPVETNAR